MPIETIRGEPFNIRFDGPEDAPVLMLSNSLGTDLHMWDPQIPEWTKQFRVLRYDSRGHGKSTAPDRPYSLAELAGDAIGIMDHFGLDKVHWCGVSMGGMVGQWLATHAPRRLHRVVLANTSARMGPPDLWNGRIRNVRANGMEPLVQPTLERWFSPGFRERGGKTVEAVSAMLTTTPPLGYAGCCAAIRDMDQREAITAIVLPVLVIVGALDPATPPAIGQQIADSIHGAELVTLDAAHLSNLEQPEAFGRAVLDFLNT